MREADSYAALVAEACDNFAAAVGTTEARVATLQWKLQQATAAYSIATGDSPSLNAVYLVVLATISQAIVENYWVGQKFGPAADPLLKVHRELEKDEWAFVAQVLTPAQQEEVRNIIQEWIKKNPNQHYVAAVRIGEFMELLNKKAFQPQNITARNLLSILSIDPLQGLDPAVQAVDQTRYAAERMMFYFQRAPMLVSWQIELLTYQLAAQPPVKDLLGDVDRLSQSAEIFARTAEGLPKLVDQEREAAINQFFAGIAVERSNIMADLSSQEATLNKLLPEARQTLAAGVDMANSLNAAIKSLDAFVHYVSPPDTNPAPVVDTNSKPFDVLDYGTAATQVGGMAKDLNTLLTSVNQATPQVAKLGQQTTADAHRVVTHAFWLALVLIVVLLAGCVVAALVYRALANKLWGRRSADIPVRSNVRPG